MKLPSVPPRGAPDSVLQAQGPSPQSHLNVTSEGSRRTPRAALGKSVGHSTWRPVSSKARCCTRRGWRLKVKLTLKVSPFTKRSRSLWEGGEMGKTAS